MVKFAHMADVHLGGWKQQPLQNLNMESFEESIRICIEERVDFLLITGDLFDSAFPPVDVLKETFALFRKLHDAKIPCFLIAGSHDYSVSGKTFLDVIEKAGFCKNVANFEERNEKIILNPTLHKNVALYGYPGKTSGMEINDLRRIEFNDAPGLFKIFLLHTTINKAKGTLPIDSLEIEKLPKADYYALGHLHIDFQYENFVYPGPLFPNNFQELEDLEYGRFCIINTEAEPSNQIKKIKVKLKDVISINLEIENALIATEKIISEIEKIDIGNKIVLLRLRGILEVGKTADISFSKIEETTKRKNAYFFLRNTHELKMKEAELEIQIEENENTEKVEEDTIKNYSDSNISLLNKHIFSLINALSTEKQEGETTESFTNRLIEESKKILEF